MSKLNITLNEQKILRKNAKSEIERLEKLFNNIELTEKLDCFKNKFNICETAYKIILTEHQRRKGNKIEHLKLIMTQVPHALRFAGYYFDNGLLNNLFNSKSNKGKSVKKLRDEITHGIKQSAVEEILTRYDELFSYMNEFINIIKNFDLIVA